MAPHIDSDGIVGYWGKPTSTIDWCEKNYVTSYYLAEFWNTITNLGMIIPPVYGIIDSLRQGFELRYTLCYALLLLTGIGSWMFHMTLLFEMQLLDELPMVWGGSFMLYSLYRSRNSFVDGGRIVGVILLCYAIVVTVAYLVNKNPVFHEVMYGILISAIVLLAIKYHCLYYKKEANMFYKISFFGGMFLYAFGFTLWNIDNNFCNGITHLRETKLGSNELLTYLSPLTQLHGWWHLMAGYATYLHILNCIQHRLHYLGIEYSLEMRWVGAAIRVNQSQKSKLVKAEHYQD